MPNSINTSLRGAISIHNFKCALLPRTPNSLHLHHLKNPSKDSKPHPPLITTSSSSTPPMSMIIRPPPPPPFIIDTPKEQPQHDDDDDDESLEELMKRVERVKEMMKGGEYVDKFLMRNVVGEEEEVVVMRGHVEVMVGDVVERFWEKPVEYLRSGGGRLEDRVKDLRRIVGIFEQACLDHGKEAGSSKRGKQCPFLQSFVRHN